MLRTLCVTSLLNWFHEPGMSSKPLSVPVPLLGVQQSIAIGEVPGLLFRAVIDFDFSHVLMLFPVFSLFIAEGSGLCSTGPAPVPPGIMPHSPYFLPRLAFRAGKKPFQPL